MFEWIQDDHEADSARVGTYNKKTISETFWNDVLYEDTSDVLIRLFILFALKVQIINCRK